MSVTAQNLIDGLGLDPVLAASIVDELNEAMSNYGIDANPQREAMFLAQCCVESNGFTTFTESLNYSDTALMVQWPSHFDIGLAQQLGRNSRHGAFQDKIANIAYANRMGNGDVDSGDGWKYRGRGCIQITGRNAYAAAGASLMVDLIGSPDQVAASPYRSLTAGWFWSTNGLDAMADASDVEGVTKKINGGLNGIAQRTAYFNQLVTVLS